MVLEVLGLERESLVDAGLMLYQIGSVFEDLLSVIST